MSRNEITPFVESKRTGDTPVLLTPGEVTTIATPFVDDRFREYLAVSAIAELFRDTDQSAFFVSRMTTEDRHDLIVRLEMQWESRARLKHIRPNRAFETGLGKASTYKDVVTQFQPGLVVIDSPDDLDPETFRWPLDAVAEWNDKNPRKSPLTPPAVLVLADDPTLEDAWAADALTDLTQPGGHPTHVGTLRNGDRWFRVLGSFDQFGGRRSFRLTPSPPRNGRGVIDPAWLEQNGPGDGFGAKVGVVSA